MSDIGNAATQILNIASPEEKVRLSHLYANAWARGELVHEFSAPPPARPARPEKPSLLMPRFMAKRRNMAALLHAIAHIEFNAINLAWDIIARFGHQMPREFCDDWVQVADDEARHFDLLSQRLAAYGAQYGDLPAHDGLWQSAMDTAHELKARLAVVPLVLEARGLDVTPPMIKRFEKAQDLESAQTLKLIYQDEISHVRAGQKWFNYLCEKDNSDSKLSYQNLVRQYFKGQIKPPFNRDARNLAGQDEDYYLPLSC